MLQKNIPATSMQPTRGGGGLEDDGKKGIHVVGFALDHFFKKQLWWGWFNGRPFQETANCGFHAKASWAVVFRLPAKSE